MGFIIHAMTLDLEFMDQFTLWVTIWDLTCSLMHLNFLIIFWKGDKKHHKIFVWCWQFLLFFYLEYLTKIVYKGRTWLKFRYTFNGHKKKRKLNDKNKKNLLLFAPSDKVLSSAIREGFFPGPWCRVSVNEQRGLMN